MRKVIILVLVQCFALGAFAHDGGHHRHDSHKTVWKLKSSETFHGSLISMSGKKAFFELADGEIAEKSISDFSDRDQEKLHSYYANISTINGVHFSRNPFMINLVILSFITVFISLVLFNHKVRHRFKIDILIPKITLMLSALLFLFACSDDDAVNNGASNPEAPANDPNVLSAIFEQFDGVSTNSDDTWFYVSSNGLPGHNMMVGITNWQQQVPIDHEYTGGNSWAIPLRPKFAEEPISTKTNLLKGAIAIAANGIPVFNPLNNRGEDANAIGELDQWGGHCGRADDYHYHIPPTHLQETVGEGNPIAYAVDGFPIYGETTAELDEYLGILNADGSYQYHTISEYPYFMAGVRGEITLDPNTTAPENQVIPQAMSQGVRDALAPLPGAEITGFQASGPDSYSLTYTLNAQTYVINYGWTATGEYTYEFVAPDGNTTKEIYQRNQ